MAGYLAMRIEAGKLDYTTVIMRYPQFKADIDTILVNDGFQDLIADLTAESNDKVII